MDITFAERLQRFYLTLPTKASAVLASMDVMTNDQNEGAHSGRWQRREGRRRQERARLKKHAAGLRRIYLDAVRKRLEERRQRK